MNRSLRTTSCIFIVVGLLVQLAFARQKTPKAPKNKFVTTANTTVPPKPSEVKQGRVILVLQTRAYLVTVRSRAGETRYSVATLQGIVLAEHLSMKKLKDRFPEVHEVVQGIAWAGVIERRGVRSAVPDHPGGMPVSP